MLQNRGRETLCSAEGEGASSAVFCLCTDLSPTPSHAELGPRGSPPRPRSQAQEQQAPHSSRPLANWPPPTVALPTAAPRQQPQAKGLAQTSLGSGEQARPVPLPQEEEELARVPLLRQHHRGTRFTLRLSMSLVVRHLCTQPSLATQCFLYREGLLPTSP